MLPFFVLMELELLTKILKFSTFGITIEIIFTSLSDNFEKFKKGEKLDFSLKGYTYIWMIPIYAMIPIIAPILLSYIESYHYLLRYFLISLLILVIEYIAGFLLVKLTGRCPWQYEKGWHIHHLIRIDYIPFWMIFAAIIEWLYYNY